MTHPGLILILSAALAAPFRGKWRNYILLFGSIVAFVTCTQLVINSTSVLNVGFYTVSFMQVDRLSFLFGLIFTIATFMGLLYGLHNTQTKENVSATLYAGAAIGVVFSGDWLTLFVFWELLAISSLVLIWYGGSTSASRAGYRYLLVHIFGGSLLLFGILLHIGAGGSNEISILIKENTYEPAYWLIFFGIIINAAVPPLHAWLTDAYPEASIQGSVFLSAFTTKAAVYALIRTFPGEELLVWFGVAMALYGVVYAVLENDIRRLLAYHIVSQVGYMVTAVGMGTTLSLDGASAHAFSHILYKSLLFMGAGAVIYATGLRKLSELGGIGQNMKIVVILYTIGAFSISGVPLFNGFISKSIIISAATVAHRPIIELLLTLASIGTFLHTGLKLPYFTFFGKQHDVALRPIPKNMLYAMGLGAFLCTVFGFVPSLLYQLLPWSSEYHPYTFDHLISSSQLLFGTGVCFWLLLSKLDGEATISIDTDWFYRRPLALLTAFAIDQTRQLGMSFKRFGNAILVQAWEFSQQPTKRPESSSDVGTINYDPYRFRLPIGVTVFWIIAYLTFVVLLSLFRS